MIRSLYIKNIAVAKDVEVEFRPGFTAVTGETGAGKSVMVDCLGLIAGAKSSRELIRSGEKTASVSAVFSDIHDSHGFEEFSPDENGDILITRTFASDSRTALKVNGKPVSISELKQFAPRMIGISSQSEKEYLGDRKQLTDILDSFAGNGDVLADYAGRYSILCDMENELLKLKDRPTAVLTTNYEVSLGVIMALNEQGIGCPEDVSLIGFDELILPMVMRPKLTLVAQPMEEIASEGARILLKRIEVGNSFPPQRVSLYAALKEGESVRRIDVLKN